MSKHLLNLATFEDGFLNIVHLASTVGQGSGGIGPVTINLTKEQLRSGNQATIWCLDSSDSLESVADLNQLSREVFTSFTVNGPRWVGFSLGAERAAVSEKGQAYSIFHQHGIWMANSRVTNLWRSRFRRPTIIAPHGALESYALGISAWKKMLAKYAYEGENLRSAACLHATGISEASSFRRYGLNNPIAIIPNGVQDTWIKSRGNPDRFRTRYSIPENKRVLLFLSRLHPKKGLALLFQAVARIHQQLDDWYLVIAGPDEVGHRRELESLAGKYRITHHIQFTGPLLGDEKRDAFAAAELFILPTYSENFGIVVAEALGAGVPAIVTRGAPWQEVEERHCGWWTDTSIEALCTALLDATSLPRDELAVMGQRGKDLVSEKYVWSQIAKKTIVLYKWLLGLGPKPSFVTSD